MKLPFTTLFCSSLCFAALPAIAAGSSTRSARAEALSQQAQALLDAGRIEAACAKFEASESAASDLGTVLHLADCYERAGRTASAWHTFREAAALAQASKDVEREQVATQRAAALDSKLTRVALIVPVTSRVPGLTVRLGNNTIPARLWGTFIPVDAGAQSVSASAKGYRSWRLDLDVASGEGRPYRVNVPLLDPAADPSAGRRGAFRTAGVVTGSVGLAGIGAGAVFSALSRNSEEAVVCARSGIQCASGKSSAPAYANAATVSYAVGGALLATGVTLFVLAPSPDNQERHALRVAARVATGGGRLQLEGAW